MDWSELRRTRERLGFSLRDIADRTKIREAILHAIEHNETDRLPPPIFTRGFVKAYARELGLDPQRFAELPAERPALVPARVGEDSLAATDGQFEDRDTSGLSTAALIVIAGLLFILTDPWKAPTPAADGTASSPAEAASPRGTVVDVAVATTGAARPSNMRLELLPQGPCWIEATADGERVIYSLLDAGDRYAIEGYEDLVLKVGDPAALVFSLNGSPGRLPGPAGQPATVHITRENSHEFTQS
jgi:cytoskeletal protein RodZ